jgi:hypothetical protein
VQQQDGWAVALLDEMELHGRTFCGMEPIDYFEKIRARTMRVARSARSSGGSRRCR